MSDLSDLPGDDAVELASRYLDGDLSIDERAAAEADPDVMAWVERFGGLQEALREPVEVDAGIRDAAIAAALAALDEAADQTVAPPPGVGNLAAARARRSRRLGAWLGSAAAVVALGIGGAVLVANSGGGDDAANDQETFAAAVEVGSAATEVTAEKGQAADSPPSPMAAPATGMYESTTADDAARTGESATTPADGDTTAAEASGGAPASSVASAETTAGGAATTAASTGAADAPLAQPTDLQQLADATPITLPDGGEAPCADDASGEPVAVDVPYRGVPAVVYRDSPTHTLTAWSLDSCERLADYVYTAG